jgi:hypothetical protein
MNFFNLLHTLRYFFSSKCRLFHKATFFGSCIIRILPTGCAKIKMPNSGAKRLRSSGIHAVSLKFKEYKLLLNEVRNLPELIELIITRQAVYT